MRNFGIFYKYLLYTLDIVKRFDKINLYIVWRVKISYE